MIIGSGNDRVTADLPYPTHQPIGWGVIIDVGRPPREQPVLDEALGIEQPCKPSARIETARQRIDPRVPDLLARIFG
jgi:hypothetical protein